MRTYPQSLPTHIICIRENEQFEAVKFPGLDITLLSLAEIVIRIFAE